MSAAKRQIVQFSMVGAANFFLTFLIYWSALQLSVHYLIALSMAWFGGNIFTYICNFVWVFKPEEKLVFKGRLLKYLFANGISFVFNLLVLNVMVEQGGLDPFYAQIILIPFIVLFNFSASKFWSMRKLHDVSP